MRFYFLVCLFSLFLTNLKADGILTDGQSTVEWETSSEGELEWYLDDSDVNQAYQLWFWYRINAETKETILPEPDSESFVGNTATLNWANVNGSGFDIVITAILKDSPGNSANLGVDMAITNNSGSTLKMELFQYIDLDKGDSSGEDVARLVGPNLIEVEDTSTGDICQFSGVNATAYQVLEYSDLEDNLEDDAITTLDNTGLPFGPEDFTGAFQWSLNIANGATSLIESGSGGNEAAPVVTAPIPTLSQWGLGIFGLLLLNLGVVFIYRQERMLIKNQ